MGVVPTPGATIEHLPTGSTGTFGPLALTDAVTLTALLAVARLTAGRTRRPLGLAHVLFSVVGSVAHNPHVHERSVQFLFYGCGTHVRAAGDWSDPRTTDHLALSPAGCGPHRSPFVHIRTDSADSQASRGTLCDTPAIAGRNRETQPTAAVAHTLADALHRTDHGSSPDTSGLHTDA